MSGPDLTIFLVEDNDIDVMVVQRLMRRLRLDLPIVRASTGEEAIALLREPTEPPRLVAPYVIVLDLNMPRMSGFEFLEAIADDERLVEVPIFVLSTSTNPEDRKTAERYRIRGYVVKPITEPALREVIDSAAPR